jgi:ABC-type lipoprotein release transport system permease subunit
MKIFIDEMKYSFKTGEPTNSLIWFFIIASVGLTVIALIYFLIGMF